MKEFLKLQFTHLVIIVGEWLFSDCECHCQQRPDAYILARFGGMLVKFKIGDDVEFMFTVTNDHQDEPFELSPVTGANDAEGEPIPAEDFSVSDVRTDNEGVVSIVDTPEGGKAFHFGTSGVAHAQYDVLYRGEVVKTYEASFNVTTGAVDPGSIQGGGFVIPGLTPDPEA